MEKLFRATLLSLALIGTYAYAEPSYLEATYGISAEEAQLRLGLQEQVIALSEKLNTENDPNYADMYIQHTPVYKIVILFSDNKNRHQFLKSLDPKLQRYVQLKNVKKSRSQYEQELNELGKLIQTLGIPYTAKFDLEKQRYEVTVENKDDFNAIKQEAKKLSFKNDIHLEIGSLPVSQSAPTGVQKGDKVFGGNKITLQPNNTGGYCTIGYAVNYKVGAIAKQGILTAGHCSKSINIDINGRNIAFSNPIVWYSSKEGRYGDGKNDKYDYAVFDATGLALTNEVKYKNTNGIPEFAKPAGTFKVTKTLGFMNQKKGMIVCKSGQTTGITCGEITNGNYTRNGASGWIEVKNSKQPNVSAGGDSGGPWFLYPGKATTITAVGIHSAGDEPSANVEDFAIYMPIDYIDDHNSSISLILK
ncbi:S1 family peptidase [Moraxella marmotae]|uniref:S1 family peptidase n=1 Tax=Moraxella marmotae TaxID=3344520 RepID=UPI0035F2FBC6